MGKTLFGCGENIGDLLSSRWLRRQASEGLMQGYPYFYHKINSELEPSIEIQ
jgi:hypothetical protein